MGDIADMIINGDLCEECGVYMAGGAGYPRKCASCNRRKHKRKPSKAKEQE